MSLRVGALLPAFSGAARWFNGEPAPPADAPAVLVHFWAVPCPACKANLPEVQRVQAAYRDRGLYVVAVHMPRTEADTDIGVVARAVAELGITEPCAADNTHAIGDRFETTGLWPYYYLFDGNRTLRRHAAGGNGFALIERVAARLLPAG